MPSPGCVLVVHHFCAHGCSDADRGRPQDLAPHASLLTAPHALQSIKGHALFKFVGPCHTPAGPLALRAPVTNQHPRSPRCNSYVRAHMAICT
jgi:hypothetical protein